VNVSTTSTGLTDQALAASALQGDRQAFTELVYRHREGVFRFVYRMCGDIQSADEAAQEAFIRAWQKLASYKPQYPFRNWIYSIAAHAAQDEFRREPPTVDLDTLEISDGKLPEAEAEDHERARIVRKAVLELPAASRAVLVLREYEGLSYQEISSVLSIPVGTVMSRLSYARSLLKEKLADCLEV
jgi:RNA polymerase sigma-70 factor (ECF subfamily)